MSKTRIGAELRRSVALRADFLCEYCLLHEADTYFGCEIDHIISEKHGGSSGIDNLAYACLLCNRNKGSDIASLTGARSQLTRLFNPRRDRWRDHFMYRGGGDGSIEPLTEIGEATVRILGLNLPERKIERIALGEVGRYPTPQALERMEGV